MELNPDNRTEMIKLIDKKLDLDVWQEVNHRNKILTNSKKTNIMLL